VSQNKAELEEKRREGSSESGIRKEGIVINLSSVTGVLPSPNLSVYGSTKAYVEQLTESLQVEYEEKGIVFQCLSPGPVVSSLDSHLKADELSL
jgi:uncharacterized protein